MSKVAVVYWSGTGNTETMANAVAEGVQGKGAEAVMIGPSDFTADSVTEYDGIAFGCPAMGAEQLEEAEYQPMCEWMRLWEDEARDAGADLVVESVMANNEPDDDAIEACKALGAALA